MYTHAITFEHVTDCLYCMIRIACALFVDIFLLTFFVDMFIMIFH